MVLKEAAVMMALLLVFEKKGSGSPPSCSSDSFYIEDFVNDHSLGTRTFATSTMVEDGNTDCFLKCTKNCKCLSFNICGRQCQINADRKEMKNNSLTMKYGCIYYDIQVSLLLAPTLRYSC